MTPLIRSLSQRLCEIHQASALICWLTAAWVTNSSAAARVKLR